jgi:hypothetical protein
MAKDKEARARHERQARVASAVWGLVFIAMGALVLLDNAGRIDLRNESRLSAKNAVDGKVDTRWSSAFSEPQWIAIDLGAPAEITRVRLNWEKAFAKDYRIETSDDGSSWTLAREVTDGDGGLDEHELNAHGRYVRVYATRRSTPWGFSLWEFEVIGTMGETSTPGLLSQGRRATASSTESNYYLTWLTFWPVLLIAGGLPLVLAPKDQGEQVFGFCLTGVGAFLQLERLGLVPWTFGQVWPVLLVGAGLLLVLQALRQSRAKDEPPSSGGGLGPAGGCP